MFWCLNFPVLLAQAAAPQPAQDLFSSMWFKLLLALFIVVGSFALGPAIARWLRMPDYGAKIGLIVFTLVASVSVCILGWPPKRGIDLSGGVQLVYEVDVGLVQSANLEMAASLLNKDFESGGDKLSARITADGRVEVFVPLGLDIEVAKERVARVPNAGLNLDNVSQRKEGEKTTLLYDPARQAQQTVDAERMDKLIAAVSRRINPGGVKELTIRKYGGEQIEIIIPEVEKQEVELVKAKVSKSGLLEFRILADPKDYRDQDAVTLAEQQSPAQFVYKGTAQVARWVKVKPDVGTEGAVTRQTESRGKEVLVLLDKLNVTGDYLTHSVADIDEHNQWCVRFKFNSAGGQLFGELTSSNLPTEDERSHRRLGILLDNELVSAPNIITTIREDGQITGSFTEREVKLLVEVLNAGSLTYALRPEPISEQHISAQLGDETIRLGAMSMIVSTVAILAFMLIYYRFAGFVADVAVTLNIIVTVALMIAMKAAFTLTGLAGLVLTVGMAVDANVLIYERMREEARHGSSLRMTIRNAFSRAMATIIDSHVTTIITGIVLFIIGTDQIKGFAVTLTIGLFLSLFTAIFVARVFFDIVEKQRWLTKLNMMHLIRETHFDFIRLQWPAISISVILILVGMVGVYLRGFEIFDIDFTGGSSVQIAFKESKKIADVRARFDDKVDKLNLNDVTVSSVGLDDTRFKIDTSNENIKEVQAEVQRGFPDELRTYSMTFKKPAQIEPRAGATLPEIRGQQENPASAPKDQTKPEDKTATPPAKPEQPDKPPAADSPPSGEKTEQPAGKPPAEDDSSHNATPRKGAVTARPTNVLPASLRGHRVKIAELASAGRDDIALGSLLLAQADDKASASGKESAEDSSTEDSSDAGETSKEPAKEPKGEADQPKDAVEKPKGEAPATDTNKKNEKPIAPGPKPDGKAPAARSSTIGQIEASYAGGTRVDLHFGKDADENSKEQDKEPKGEADQPKDAVEKEPIKHSTLEEMVKQQLKKAGQKPVPFELTNANFQVGSEKAYEDWTLYIMLPPDQTERLVEGIQSQLMQTPIFPSSSQIGGKVAGDTQLMALYALLASMAVIVVYIWIRFQNVIFGVGAIVALVHDVLITLGFIALSSYLAPYLGFAGVDPFKISLSVVAAMLTIVGYSINDTIVVFDRIREVRGKSPELTEQMINDSVNQTLSRTLLTSGTVLIGALILYLIGGQGIHAFAYAMLVGVVAGTYSSVYIASPILLWMKKPPASERAAGRSDAVQTAGAAYNKGPRNSR